MRAPVYKHVETQSTIAGLSLTGLMVVLGVAFVAIQVLGTGTSLVAILATYVLLRLSGRGRPPLYWVHWTLFQVRRRRSGGRLSPGVRPRIPQFPFGAYESRDRL